jgi:acetylglutamate kinase
VKVLIKVGGTLLDEPDSRNAIANQLADIAREHEVLVVHGGGKQVTRFLEERGVSTRFVDGLRVSDKAVIDAVTKVIAGSVNKQLVSAIIRAGKLAVGLSGVDGLLTHAMPRHPELGFVGNPTTTDPRLIDSLINLDYLPVIACIAADEHGTIYNVNADQMAVSCALCWRSDTLILLTDVDGVQDEQGEVLGELNLDDIADLIASGVASRGMRAKLTSAAEAMRAGLQEVIIASGHASRICQRILSGEGIGTRLCSKHVFARGLVP